MKITAARFLFFLFVCITLGVYVVIYITGTTCCKYINITRAIRKPFTVTNITSSLAKSNTEKKAKHKVINIYEYNFYINPNFTCNKEDVNMIIIIKSAVGNFARRSTIRRTWANHEVMRRLKLKRMFVIGLSKDTLVEKKVMLEVEYYKDVLQIDFYDNYYNNTLKTTGAVNWVRKFCGEAKFVFFVDDDYFVSTDKLASYVNSPEYTKSKCVYTGSINHDGPIRNRKSKWYVSKEDYPDDTYPPFVRGGAWLASKLFVKNLSVGIEHTKRFIFDDVFIALVARQINVTPCNEPRFSAATLSYNHPRFKTTFAVHGYVKSYEVSRAWKCTINPVTSSAYPKHCIIVKT